MNPSQADLLEQNPSSVSKTDPAGVFEHLRQTRARRGAPLLKERVRRLKALRAAIMDSREEIKASMLADFGKPKEETDLTEIAPVLVELKEALAGIRSWTKPHRVRTPLVLFGTRTRIHYQPRGIVLILSPWNYPINLTLGPLVSALAAGNAVVIKPSEHTPNASAVVRRIVETTLPPDECVVVTGDAETAKQLVRLPFDHIFFTGSPEVGRRVMAAAAENHTSVTLELGGKSPAIVDISADLDRAAKTIAFGKFSNAGQTCIAPDYVLVRPEIHETFVDKLAAAVRHMFPGDATTARSSTAGIISEGRCRHLRGMLDEAVAGGAVVHLGGVSNIRERRFQPTIVSGVPSNSTLMQEEIFGPILPVLTFSTLSEAVDVISSRPPPLTLYLYAKDRRLEQEVLNLTRAGSTVVNDTLIQWIHTRAPFGGVGSSGFGRSHGFSSFKTFSNERSVVRQVFPWPPIHLLYPPFARRSNTIREWVLRYLRL